MRKKRQRTGILFALMIPLLAISIEVMGGGTTVLAAETTSVSYHVDPAYSVTIPIDTSMQFNGTSASYGKIAIEEAKIDDGKCIQVSLVSDFTLKNQSDKNAVIPYKILADGSLFTTKQYTKAGEVTPLTIEIAKDDWKKATAGTYQDVVTFTVSYVDKSE